ncbi:uncharacterized protein (DUF1800 family) [Saccharothrix tamanrassetensis]|uniref:Uncharacterized protein (DUF1800 family) n=1 Tax=Saccharothrix tamanrassetensis TaxID=1051531 RepID=A0A841CQC9_9PSEU|nr:DUF1800 domain-containing protein [Saccharothrix tamanrassetensis]MBB5959499.1 uncharacterized protein (DUF1800 family) [Saccharothrix tamanrassetensis]
MPDLDERAAVRRLHDRFCFGPRPGDLDRGFADTVDRLLAPATAATPGLTLSPPVVAKGDREARKDANRQRAADEKTLTGWWLERMVATDTATERLTWFWHGHFATSEQKVRSPWHMLAQNEKFRRSGLDGFPALAREMVVDPAMLLWLDGNDNRAGSPNENLAREFLELFTLGIGHYAEQDVREAARALTGWTVRRDSAEAELVARRHDDKPKTILGVTGAFTAQSFVDTVLARRESAEFVVGRLWFRLVSATPPAPGALARLVAAYREDIGSVLRAIAAEPAFRDQATTLVKQPVEWAVGLMRALGVSWESLDDKAVKQFGNGLRGMGQLPFRPPSVGGWAAGGAWLTTAAGVARLKVAQLIAERADLRSVTGVDAIRERLGVDAWSDRTRDALAKVADHPGQLAAVAACAPEYVVSR